MYEYFICVLRTVQVVSSIMGSVRGRPGRKRTRANSIEEEPVYLIVAVALEPHPHPPTTFLLLPESSACTDVAVLFCIHID